MRVAFELNGTQVEIELDSDSTLLDLLRNHFRLTGAKKGCGAGECGACTVLVDGEAVNSCLTLASGINGRSVLTIEGLWQGNGLHPIQEAFMRNGAFQCGYCTPGMVLSAKALLDKVPEPTDEDIVNGMAGNLCRCTGYASIARAIKDAARSSKRVDQAAALPSHELSGVDVLGKSMSDQGDIARITGSLLFADDIPVEGALFGKLYLSDIPHGEITSIDCEQAEMTASVVRVLTAKDVPGSNAFGWIIPDQPALAFDRVRFQGDVIALVLAENEAAAEEARDKIRVRYKALEGVYSPIESLREEAYKIHPNGNTVKYHSLKRGDPARGFDESDVVVEEAYQTSFIDHACLEPEAAVAIPQEDGVTVYYPTQMPFVGRKQIAACLNLPEQAVRVVSTPNGGSFGRRCDHIAAILAGLGAFLTGRPVKITTSRQESLQLFSKKHPFLLHYKTGVSGDGKLKSLSAKMIVDAGPYATYTPAVVEHAAILAGGPYYWPNVHIETWGVCTNNVIGGAMRGFGCNQTHFAVEAQMDAMARTLGIDPFEFRLLNCLEEGKATPAGEVLRHNVTIGETIRQARKALLSSEPPAPGRGKRIGIGVAAGYKNIGFGRGVSDFCGAIVELTGAGRVLVRASAVDLGQGVKAVLAQIASAATGVGYHLVDVQVGDTALVPEGADSVAQRITYLAGNAVQGAATRFRQAMLGLVADRCGCDVAELDIRGEAIVDKATQRPVVSLEQLAQLEVSEGRSIVGFDRYDGPQTYPVRDDADAIVAADGKVMGPHGQDDYRSFFAYTYLTQVAIVEVDEKTGETRVLKMIGAYDVGNVLNPLKIKGQLEGGLLMGLGYALTEGFVVDKGSIVTKGLGECYIPTIDMIPEMEVVITEDKDVRGPFGARAVAEVALVPTAPAVANAIYDAIGVRVTSLPASPEVIVNALRRQKSKLEQGGL